MSEFRGSGGDRIRRKKMAKGGNKSEKPKKTVEAVARETGRYEVEAYYFVLEALEWMLSRMGERRHVTGAELSLAIKDLAMERFGMMSRVVLENWRVTNTGDFGQIVFTMVQAGLMSKTDQDDIRDFEGVYDFAEAFGGYRISGEMTEGEGS